LKIVAAFCTTAAASLSTEEILEDVVEGLAEAASTESEAVWTAPLLSPGVAEHVIALAFFLIAQRLVGFIDFFEPLF
jgi:hypothetical protein